ncbi:hypothetical protein FGO68_gene7915 [Halteria grandinella]|uniref:Transmembrane protein n=1 Tax=Halteria grandinella TaxID=5974 RepID=A0A8J8NG53_HALGN|nr:hypothetical protein FGO68_gene7915 [Halteria grandinella]
MQRNLTKLLQVIYILIKIILRTMSIIKFYMIKLQTTLIQLFNQETQFQLSKSFLQIYQEAFQLIFLKFTHRQKHQQFKIQIFLTQQNMGSLKTQSFSKQSIVHHTVLLKTMKRKEIIPKFVMEQQLKFSKSQYTKELRLLYFRISIHPPLKYLKHMCISGQICRIIAVSPCDQSHQLKSAN